ncbi:D-beta-hydroxybutyrate dehydrogenase, mitochondrial-like [Sceloporus undulatus]|uniref:D-beta-hydroxybutyrate dehydrogenase, mitochondrial-like n=1 Tax=Sceloporus undulatus TaxID=8520 RepID=UPI001C4B9A7D|nr:D-beta-hydroxybutyrate dehydrogenase, mitochondrial-like [Sceloporus undulatus]
MRRALAAGALLLLLLPFSFFLPGVSAPPSGGGGGPAFLLPLPLLLVLLVACRSPPRLLGLAVAPRSVGEKAVLVTGCDKGFGHALARHLHAKGFTVFAGCLLKDRGGEGARELASLGSERLCVLQLDVCRQEEVDRALRFVRENLKDSGQGESPPVNGGPSQDQASLCPPPPSNGCRARAPHP